MVWICNIIDYKESLHENFKTFLLPPKMFSEIDFLNIKSPLLTISPPQIKKWDPKASASQLELLLPLQDPNNLGAAIRTASAFKASKIILLSECAYPFHPKAIRASAGTVFDTPLLQGVSIHDLSKLDLPNLVSLDLKGTNINEFSWNQHVQILVGEEGPGVPSNLKSQKIKIPISDDCESLNATVAASLAIFSYRNKFKL